MRGIQIRDLHEHCGLAVDLRHVLDLLGERALRSRWRVVYVWAIGQEGDDSAMEFEALAKGRESVPGDHLSRLAHRVLQVIDGEFLGHEGDAAPWVIVRAVDSTLYEVLSTETEVLDTVRAAFRNVSGCEQIP